MTRLIIILAALAAPVALTACGADKTETGGADTAAAK
jgi:hypothetical protein